MQTMLNLPAIYGLPLSVSASTRHLILSKEMEDHDRQREAIKKLRSRAGRRRHANDDMGFQGIDENLLRMIIEGQFGGDLALFLHFLSDIFLPSAATAA